MADLSKMSDSDLDAAISKAQDKSASLVSMSDDDLDKMIAEKSNNQGQTALEHFGQGASLGYLPQLQAKLEPLTDRIYNAATGSKVPTEDLAPMSQLTKNGAAYVKARDENIKRLDQEALANPDTAKWAGRAGMLTTGIATSGLMPEAGAASTLTGKVVQGAIQGAKTGAIYGALQNPGDKDGEVDVIQAGDRAVNTVKGAATGAAVGSVMPIAVKGASVAAQGVRAAGDKLRSFAEDTAVNATGATGNQASKFADNVGRELLDRGIVRFGDSQAKISERASAAVDQANQQIDSSLKQLQASGVKVDANTVYGTVRNTINQMRLDPSKADIADGLEKELDNIVKSTDARGSTEIGIQDAEAIKRGYNRKAGNWADPEKSQVGKEMYQTFRGAVEDAATEAYPATAAAFKEGKETYGLLSPIQEAAQRKALSASQSQPLNLKDIAMGVAGKGIPGGEIALPVANRFISPRISSSIAVTADAAANVLRSVPEFASLEAKQPAVFQALVNHIQNESGGTPLAPAAQNTPTKGPDKWANDGFQNLMQHADSDQKKQMLQQMRDRLMRDPRGRKLLMGASDLNPGTKGMQNIMDQVQSIGGKD